MEIEIPITSFTYIQQDAHSYKLISVKRRKSSVILCNHFIGKLKLDEYDIHHIHMFNTIHTIDVNRWCIEFIFISLDGHEFTVKPSIRSGRGFEIINVSASVKEHLDQWDLIEDAENTFSVYSMIHDYIENKERNFLHIGISLIPSRDIQVPFFADSKTLNGFLKYWTFHTIPIAIRNSFLSKRHQNGDIEIHKLYDCKYNVEKRIYFKTN